jgi:hypothetical protein
MSTYVACPVRYRSDLSRLRRQDVPNGRPPACIGEHRAVVDTAARGIERHPCGQLVREYACPPRTRDVCTDLYDLELTTVLEAMAARDKCLSTFRRN